MPFIPAAAAALPTVMAGGALTAATATLSATALAATAVGTGFAVYSQIQQGKAQSAMFKHGARLEKRQAKTVEEQTKEQIRQKAFEKRRFMASQIARYGISGVELAGTPITVLSETAEQFGTELLWLRKTGQDKAEYLRSSARLGKMYAQQSRRAGYWGAGSTLLTGFGQAAWMSAQKEQGGYYG